MTPRSSEPQPGADTPSTRSGSRDSERLGRSGQLPLPKRCIFCQAKKKLTREDFFPEWFRELYPASEESRRARLSAEVSWHEVHPQSGEIVARTAPSRMARAGDLADQTLKVVCGPCNNGWMSRLQQAAKPFLLPYIQGKWPRPGREARQVMSSWATMFAMVVEFGDEASAVVPPIERQVFSQDLHPPIGAFVWAGRLAGDLPYWFHRRALRLAMDSSDFLGPPNAQLTTITLGHLLLQVYLTTSDLIPFDPHQRAIEEYLSPMWPLALATPGHHRVPIRDKDQARDFAYRHVSVAIPGILTAMQRHSSGLFAGGFD